jgi:hypothetical protein
MNNRRILFVCSKLAGQALRYARAIEGLDDVTLLTIYVDDVDDAEELIGAAKSLGEVNKIVTAQETLLMAVAVANEALDLEAMSPEIVARVLDKSKLKATLKSAGVTTPHDQIVTTLDDARRFAHEVGFPIVLKPLNGSGGLTTFRITSEEQLARILDLIKPPLIAETHVHGQELCFDTVTIGNEPQCYAVCCYDPPIIKAIEQPERQWRCMIPRDLGAYNLFIEQGLAAVKALRVGNAMTHMEGFISESQPAGFIDATLRPAGARIGQMFGYAHDVDPYRVWARVAVDDAFDGPLERKYAVGTIFLRGPGSESVKIVEGIETVQEELSSVIIESRWPRIGGPKSATYTGDGFITVRHPQTSVVHEALDFIEQTVRITYSSPQPVETAWSERIDNFRELNKPAWDFEVVK